jgi:beta-galactosidase
MSATYSFGKEFVFGASTASYQVEGAVDADGRGPSIWDSFSHRPGATHQGETGDVACDHYRLWAEDVGLMERLGLEGYRFSISWSRVLPIGKGRINEKGLDFYSRLCDELLAAGISPSATLYHWDLPQALQDGGGWTNRDTIYRFVDYADLMFRRLGDRVKRWYTHNEPWVAAWVGHYQGKHAPGATSASAAVEVAHNLLVSHGEVVELFRHSSSNPGEIGIVLNLIPVSAATDSERDREAARLADGLQNRWFLDPLFRGRYPADVLQHLSSMGLEPSIREGDMQSISRPMDFLGFNFYTRKIVRAGGTDPIFRFQEEKPAGSKYTQMNWEVHPESLYSLLLRLKNEYDDPRLLITENGASFADPQPRAGLIEDPDRVEYLREHLRQAARALAEGVRLGGYYAWSLLDNFEWAFGYSRRFGLVGVDYSTQARILKRSALWYADLIAHREIEL